MLLGMGVVTQVQAVLSADDPVCLLHSLGVNMVENVAFFFF